MYGGQKIIPYDDKRDGVHQKILDALVGRIRAGFDGQSELRTRWDNDDKQYVGYVKESALDRRRNEARDSAGTPDQVTIHIPYNYAMMAAAHTYITSVMFGRSPVWQVSGRTGEGQDREQAIESYLSYQVTAGLHLPHHYVWTHDALRYGYGILGSHWTEQVNTIARIVEKPKAWLGIPMPGKPRMETVREEVYGYIGNKCYNVRPDCFFSDPRYPTWRFQEGEYCGRSFEISYLDLQDTEKFFNQRALKHLKPYDGGTSINGRGNPEGGYRAGTVLDIPSQDSSASDYDLSVKNYKCDEIHVNLIPSQWGLDPRADRPEKWCFIILEKCLIVSCQPLGLYHNMYPYDYIPAEVEGYDRASRSMLHTTQPLNQMMTWLMNSHLANVRKSINNQIITDPSRVVVSDITGPNAARLIRLKPSAYGTDIDKVFRQLQVTDITKTNISDMGVLADLMQKVTGVNDMVMGTLSQSRRSATEVRGANGTAGNRLKTMVEHMSTVGFAPHVQKLIQTSQQFMTWEMKVKLAGDLPSFSGESTAVINPETISGFFDFEVIDGSAPIDRMAQVMMWNNLMQAAIKMPQVMQGLDFVRIFMHVGELGGIRNMSKYRINTMAPGMGPPPGTVPVGQAPTGVAPPPNGLKLDNGGQPPGPQLGQQMGPLT